jgi:endogenous inhibitor of DNA gyrase (YacG/DUF329 family)
MENEPIEVEEVHDDDTTTTSEPAHNKPAKKCEHCGNDHTRGKKSRFCSDRCKNAWHRNNPRASMNDRKDNEEEENYSLPVLQSEKVVLTGIDPKAQYIIQDQARQIRELKQQYLIEKQKRSKAKDKNYQLEKELMQLRNDHALEQIENKKPSTLEGLAASPLMQELMPFIGPALGQLASGVVARVTGGASPGGMQGVEGQLDAEAQSQLIEINNWYSKIAPEEQASVYDVMTTFTRLPADKLKDVLTRMKRLLNHGTTATNHSNGTNRATGTY